MIPPKIQLPLLQKFMVLLDIFPGSMAVVWDYLNGGQSISPLGWVLIFAGSFVYYRERWAIGTEKKEAAIIKRIERKKLFDEYSIVAARKKEAEIDLDLKKIQLQVAKSKIKKGGFSEDEMTD